MRTLNILVNEIVYTTFEINDDVARSSISREVYERIYFYHLLRQQSVTGAMTRFPNIVTANFTIAIEDTKITKSFIVQAEYGFPNVIGRDLLKQLTIPEGYVSPEAEINENLNDAMGRIRGYYERHSGSSFDENVFFFDFDTIITYAQRMVDSGRYDEAISLLDVMSLFVKNKILADIRDPRRMGAFLTARFFHTNGLALHKLHRYNQAEKLLIVALTMYTRASPTGEKIYQMINSYPY